MSFTNKHALNNLAFASSFLSYHESMINFKKHVEYEFILFDGFKLSNIERNN